MATILVVDDDANIRELLTAHLRGCGYRILTAADATMAVQQIRQGKPDLLILDYLLPGGTGLTVMERLQNFMDMAGTPVIFISAKPTAEITKKIPLSGSVKFMEKPLVLRELSDEIASLLGEQPAGPAGERP